MSQELPLVLAIGGTDPSGGAGIQADIKAIHANGGYALTVVTAVTAQNSSAVVVTAGVAPEMIRAQLEAVLADFRIATVKTGMLGSADAVRIVVELIGRAAQSALVVDPVMVSTSGHRLLEEDAVDLLRTRLLPLARLCTPNRSEAEILSGQSIDSLAEAQAAAHAIRALGPRAVLIKGGHLATDRVVDLLLDGDALHFFDAERVVGPVPHGTGCTLASAIATHLALGAELSLAVARAKQYATAAIRHRLTIGRGRPVPGIVAGFKDASGRDGGWGLQSGSRRPGP